MTAIAEALRAAGIERFLINAGGDIRTGSEPGDDEPWTIAVREPTSGAASYDSETWDTAVVAETINIRAGAVATSGSYEVCFDDRRLAHHIVHADSGSSPQQALSVTVVAPTAVRADALATCGVRARTGARHTPHRQHAGQRLPGHRQ